MLPPEFGMPDKINYDRIKSEFSKIEQQILHLLAQGSTYADISSEYPEIRRLQTYIDQLYSKLGAKNENQAVFNAVKQELLSPMDVLYPSQVYLLTLLTDTENQILDLLTIGLTQTDIIAKIKNKSGHTVAKQFESIAKKLGTNRKVIAGLVYLADKTPEMHAHYQAKASNLYEANGKFGIRYDFVKNGNGIYKKAVIDLHNNRIRTITMDRSPLNLSVKEAAEVTAVMKHVASTHPLMEHLNSYPIHVYNRLRREAK